mgnify:FL=1|uniref:Uncharacterized protein n=1 Tax=viral metagenome TaxID=1070528 RepID=A0A6C0JNC3_9ZZZZ
MQSQVQYTQQPPQPAQNMGMQQQQQPVGDVIEQLPADMSVPSHNEIRIVDQLFQQKKGIFDRILGQTKDIVILGGLFIVFSLPFIDNLIKKFVTAAGTSPYILIGIKALLFVFSYFIIKNLYLARKK